MNNLTLRIITAVLLLAVAGIALFAMPPIGRLGFTAVLLLVAFWEWSGFFPGRSMLWRGCFLLLSSALLVPATHPGSFGLDLQIVAIVALVVWVLLLAKAVLRPGKLPALVVFLAGLFCLIPAWMSLMHILAVKEGSWLMLWLASMVAAADIGAYFTGKSLGRHKLAPAISPGKTIEGFVGGLVFAALAGMTGAWLLGEAPLQYALCGLAIGSVSVVGDLTVSVFKRNVGLKDTGVLLPGHGGVLDRFDSLLTASPAFLLVLDMTGRLPLI